MGGAQRRRGSPRQQGDKGWPVWGQTGEKAASRVEKAASRVKKAAHGKRNSDSWKPTSALLLGATWCKRELQRLRAARATAAAGVRVGGKRLVGEVMTQLSYLRRRNRNGFCMWRRSSPDLRRRDLRRHLVVGIKKARKIKRVREDLFMGKVGFVFLHFIFLKCTLLIVM